MSILVRVGHILGPFGLRGFLKCEYTTDLPQELCARADFLLSDPRTQECLTLRVAEVQLKPNFFIVRFEEFNTPEPLAHFKGWDIHHHVQRGELPRNEGEVFFFELAGMEVRRPDGRVLGIVCDVLDTGAHPILEVDLGGRRILIPYVKEHVPSVDVQENWLVTTYPLEQYGIEA